MTNLLAVALSTNILATNFVEFRTNIVEKNHPTNHLYIFNSANTNLVPFFKIFETNIVRIDTLEHNWRGDRMILDRTRTTIFSTQAVFQLNWCKGEWERIQ